MIVALGKIVVQMTTEQFTELAILKNRRDLIEAEERKSSLTYDDEWDEASRAYISKYSELLQNCERITAFEELFYL